jgi:hypothetical protein
MNRLFCPAFSNSRILLIVPDALRLAALSDGGSTCRQGLRRILIARLSLLGLERIPQSEKMIVAEGARRDGLRAVKTTSRPNGE